MAPSSPCPPAAPMLSRGRRFTEVVLTGAGAGLLTLCATTSAFAEDFVLPEGQTATRSGEQIFGTVEIDGTLAVKDYDGEPSTGWLYIRAGKITVGQTGLIDAQAAGYRSLAPNASAGPAAGASPEAMNGEPLPGGGGGHVGDGGAGRDDMCNPLVSAPGGVANDPNPAMPFALFDSPEARQQGMGSAGGASWAGSPNQGVQRAGGDGGGVVILEAAEIELLGSILADGAELGTNLQGSGPGGGAGGTIVLRTNALTTGPSAWLSARGARGGISAPIANSIGGGGGGGFVIVAASGDLSAFLGNQTDVQAGDLSTVCSVNPQSGSPGLAAQIAAPPCIDADGDGTPSAACGGDDCDDGDPGIFPGAEEICDGIDQSCSGAADDEANESLCPQGSGTICVAGSCVPGEGNGAGVGGGAGIAPEVELRGALCATRRGAQGGRSWPLSPTFVMAAAALFGHRRRRR